MLWFITYEYNIRFEYSFHWYDGYYLNNTIPENQIFDVGIFYNVSIAIIPSRRYVIRGILLNRIYCLFQSRSYNGITGYNMLVLNIILRLYVE